MENKAITLGEIMPFEVFPLIIPNTQSLKEK